jgi:rhamnose utilization protein RhaD (predicted bifunctional aldolase and dehydrogenase)
MNLKNSVTNYSAQLGADPMLVQGAGGNVSWKEQDTLWIKASGTWLADANTRDIFIPLALTTVKELIANNNTDLSSSCLTETSLRPSIETSLHALLPQRIVIHVHAIEVIALAVQHRAKQILTERLSGLNWTWIDYVKPGLDLTKKIAACLSHDHATTLNHPPATCPLNTGTPNIIVLGNHGLVVAGDSIQEINTLLHDILSRCETQPRDILEHATENNLNHLANEWKETDYELPKDTRFHSLALNKTDLNFARLKWVMYPDHAIFLGGNAILKNDKPPRDFLLDHISYSPPCIIIADQGVVVHKNFTTGQRAMLHCYLDVVSRLTDPEDINSLDDEQINELLNWNAEKYRQMVNLTI